jgi:hypothetical protein
LFKSYEAIIENGQVKWLADEPSISNARVIVTVLEDTTPTVRRRTPPASIAGKGKTLGDLVRSVVEEQDWECLK